MSLLYMIRHAQASFAEADYDRLSPLGHEQAGLLAAHLARSGVEFDAVYRGRQRRHEQTLEAYLADCARRGIKAPAPQESRFFDEYDAGAILRTFLPVLIREDPGFEAEVEKMKSSNRAFQKVLEKVLLRWFDHRDETQQLESWASFTARVQRGLFEVMAREGAGRRVAVFTSGGPISAAVQKALTLSNESTLSIVRQIVNSSVTRFKYSGDRMTLFGFNDFTHLEPGYSDRLITYR